MIFQSLYESPIGKILLQSDNYALTGLDFVDETHPHVTTQEILRSAQNDRESQSDRESRADRENQNDILRQTVKELDEYFSLQRTTFTVPISQEGTSFQVSVWNALTTIPYGKTCSYLDVATQIGNPKAVRAVGLTNGKNPIAVIVPCHRVIGKNGKMVGYSSGLWRKEWLLAHEQKFH